MLDNIVVIDWLVQELLAESPPAEHEQKDKQKSDQDTSSALAWLGGVRFGFRIHEPDDIQT
jgi:hypothetical protein